MPHPNQAPISTFGSENVYVALHYSRKGALIELTAELVQYLPQIQRYMSEEIAREVTTDKEDAFSYACDLEYADRSAKGQFRQADRMGARFAVVIGDEELAAGVCSLRDMTTGEQREISVAEGHEQLLMALDA